MFHRAILRLAALKPVSLLLARLLPPTDRIFLRLSGGKRTLSALLTRIETVVLTTTGAKSGLPRQTTLFAFWDGPRAILIASNFGQKGHPAWHYNLLAHPRAVLSWDGEQCGYRARQAKGDERERYYQLAVSVYPGYAEYRRRASQREIAVWILEPE